MVRGAVATGGMVVIVGGVAEGGEGLEDKWIQIFHSERWWGISMVRERAHGVGGWFDEATWGGGV